MDPNLFAIDWAQLSEGLAAIYGTGWDGHVVIEANSAGQMVIITEE